MKRIKLLVFSSTLLFSIVLANYGFFYDQFVWERQHNLEQAAYKGDIGAMKLWLMLGAKPDNMALNSAASNNNPDTLRLLLDRGAEVNSSIKIGTTPLHSAASAGQAENVKLLLQRGAQINRMDDSGTPLDSALKQHRIEVIGILEQAGAKTGYEIRTGVNPRFTF